MLNNTIITFGSIQFSAVSTVENPIISLGELAALKRLHQRPILTPIVHTIKTTEKDKTY
jgi:hypothetical protein